MSHRVKLRPFFVAGLLFLAAAQCPGQFLCIVSVYEQHESSIPQRAEKRGRGHIAQSTRIIEDGCAAPLWLLVKPVRPADQCVPRVDLWFASRLRGFAGCFPIDWRLSVWFCFATQGFRGLVCVPLCCLKTDVSAAYDHQLAQLLLQASGELVLCDSASSRVDCLPPCRLAHCTPCVGMLASRTRS